MKHLSTVLLLVSIAVLGLPAAARAGSTSDHRSPTSAVEQAKKRWEKLTPEERREILDAWKRWKNLTDAQRKARLRLFRKYFAGTTPEEQEEILHRILRLEHKKLLQSMDERRKRLKIIEERFKASLPPDTVRRLHRLPPSVREDAVRFAVARMGAALRRAFYARLSPAQRKRLEKLRGRARSQFLHQVRESIALRHVPAAERKRLSALSPPARRRKIESEMRKIREKDLKAAHAAALSELNGLLDPPGRARAKLAHLRLLRTARILSTGDRSLQRKLERMDDRRLASIVKRLRRIHRIQDPKQRRKAMAALERDLEKAPRKH